MQAKDLMTFLLDEFNKTQAPLSATDGFIKWARGYLNDVNPPMNLIYMPVGLGLRLRNGEIVCFSDQGSASADMRDEGIPITRPTRGGAPDLINSQTFPV